MLSSCHVHETSCTLKGLLVCLHPRPPRTKADMTSNPALDTEALCWAERLLWSLSACSLIMHNACISILWPCPTHTELQTVFLSAKKASRSKLSAQSQASEDAVTFPKEIPFPRKQSWHWHRHLLVCCQGIPTMAKHGIMRSDQVVIQDFVGNKLGESLRAGSSVFCLTRSVDVQQLILTRFWETSRRCWKMWELELFTLGL